MLVKKAISIIMFLLLLVAFTFNPKIEILIWVLFNSIPCLAIYLHSTKNKLLEYKHWVLLFFVYTLGSFTFEIIRPIMIGGIDVISSLLFSLGYLIISYIGLYSYTFKFMKYKTQVK